MPTFKHDCENCIFIGHFHEHDVYVCVSRHEPNPQASIIARHGDDGPDYASVNVKFLQQMVEVENQHPEGLLPATKAWVAAIKRLEAIKPLFDPKLVDTLQPFVQVSNMELAS